MENQKPKSIYTATDTAFAWLSILFAFLFCQSVPVTNHPLGGFLVILALYSSGFVIFKMKKVKPGPVCILIAISSLCIGAALLLTDAWFLMTLAMTYCLANYCFFLYTAFGNRVEAGFSDYIYLDFIKALFVLPFCSCIAIFRAIFNRETSKTSLFLVKILIGILLAIFPTTLVFLFLSYDSGFMKLLDDMFSVNILEIFHTIVSLFFTLPLAMYGFGLYASANRKCLHDKITGENCDKVLSKTKILPQLTAVVTVLPILFLYVVFFISQWKYYISGFTGVLPQDFSYAEYARQGFFELCAVSVINLLLIIGIAFFIRRGKKGAPVILKIVATVFCLCTLILISTAVAKLVMYIDNYGLTQKRIYAMWLMALIGILFVVIAAGQYLRKLKVVALCLTVSIVMFTGLSVCNVNALCAQYNADRYLSGSLKTLDLEAMEELGDSAVPSLVQVVASPNMKKDTQLKRAIDGILFDKKAQYQKEKSSVFAFNIPSLLARSALKDYDPATPPAGTYAILRVWVNDSLQRPYPLSAEDATDILVINPDRTATITYQDKSLTFQMTGSTITLNDIPFEITCVWDEEYKLTDVNLRSVDQEIDYYIMLEPFIPE